PTRELGRERRAGAERAHLIDEHGHDFARESRGVRRVARHAGIRQQHVRETAHASRCVVEHNRHARAKADGNEPSLPARDREMRNANVMVAHAATSARRKMRLRWSTVSNSERTGPNNVSTLPSTR